MFKDGPTSDTDCPSFNQVTLRLFHNEHSLQGKKYNHQWRIVNCSTYKTHFPTN